MWRSGEQPLKSVSFRNILQKKEKNPCPTQTTQKCGINILGKHQQKQALSGSESVQACERL